MKTPSITLVASEPHYADHLEGIWESLPDDVKGDRFLPQDLRNRTKRIADVRSTILLVAGYADVKRFPLHRYVYVEHGAGQSYVDIAREVRSFYSGGNGHQNCVLFLCPNDEVAARWLARYPNKPTAVVGSPRLDSWHRGDRGQYEPHTVAVTFHWDAQFTGIPETTSAFGYYSQHLIDAVVRWNLDGYHVLGHNHPRYPAVAEFWRSAEMRALGVEYVESGSDVLDRAEILVADNTSMQAEFLSLGRSVVWLNHPSYRRDVEHGGRFWTWPTFGGVQIDTPEDLSRLHLGSLSLPTGHPYAFDDGRASERAASSILSALG